MTPEKPTLFTNSIKFPALTILVLWIIQVFQMVTHISLSGLGVYPRHPYGIKGIFTSPFIHSSDVMHLIHNSVPLFVGMSMILFFYRRIAFKAIFVIYILTGLGVWLFARPVLHIGASGVVYGLISFIFWNGIFRRNLKSIVLALIVVLLYSGMLVGVLPNQPGISWESHLIGGIVGIIASYLFRHQIETDERIFTPTHLDEEHGEFFLDRHTFEKTRSERRDDESGGWFSDSTY